MTTPNTSISLASVQSEFGGSNPISINEYYKGGSYVNSNQTSPNGVIPTGSTISLLLLRNVTKYIGFDQASQSISSNQANAQVQTYINFTFNPDGSITPGWNQLGYTPITNYGGGWGLPALGGLGSSYDIRYIVTQMGRSKLNNTSVNFNGVGLSNLQTTPWYNLSSARVLQVSLGAFALSTDYMYVGGTIQISSVGAGSALISATFYIDIGAI